MKTTTLVVTLLFLGSLQLHTCEPDNIAIVWADFQKTQLSLSFQTNFTFNFDRAFRAAGVLYTAMYDTWALYDKTSDPYVANIRKNQITPRPHADLNKAISFAAYRALSGSLGSLPPAYSGPMYQSNIDAFFASLGYNKNDVQQNTHSESGLGNLVAALVLANYSQDGTNSDGSHPAGDGLPFSDTVHWTPVNDAFPQLYITECSKVRDINHWQPALVRSKTGNLVSQKLEGSRLNMANAVPFAMSGVAEFRPPTPPFIGALQQDLVDENIDDMLGVFGNLGDEEKAKAWFWHTGENGKGNDVWLIEVALDAARVKGLSLGDTLKLLFGLAWSQWDAFIVQYDGKLFYNAYRPTTAIQCLRAGQTINSWRGPYLGVGNMNASEWRAYLGDNAVQNLSPEYPCGHCMGGSAAYEYFKIFFGSDTYLGRNNVTFPAGSFPLERKITEGQQGWIPGVTDVPNSGPGTVGYAPATDITITWPTWSSASYEVGRARIMLGVHWEYSRVISKPLGEAITRNAFDKLAALWKTWNPSGTK